MSDTYKLTYIEASTGNRWHLDEFAKRMGKDNLSIDFYALYEFDKQPVLDKVLSSDEKPDTVVVQECSVYFPGDLENYKKQFSSWMESIREKNIKPVIATTVPPAKSMGLIQDIKNFIKKYILGRVSQYEQVVEFNDWLREYAKKENIDILDLEKALRISDTDRHMKDEYNSGDGIHLNKKAYKILDKLFSDALDNELAKS